MQHPRSSQARLGMQVATYGPWAAWCTQCLLGSSAQIRKKNKLGKVDWSRHFERLSPDAQGFVQALLMVDPSQRPSAREALDHPWLRSSIGSREVAAAPGGAVTRLPGDVGQVAPSPSAKLSSADLAMQRAIHFCMNGLWLPSLWELRSAHSRFGY